MQNITNEQFCIQVMLYTRTGGVGRGVLQICSTVHIIAILRIYRDLLLTVTNGGWGRGKKLYETSIAIKSQNSCHGNPALHAQSATTLHSRLTNDA